MRRSSTFGRSCMDTIQLPNDFKEFLRLLNSRSVEYLVVGGYAVAHYGHPRATGDLDVWIGVHPENAERVRAALCDFGFAAEAAASAPLDVPGKIVRMGVPPIRIELLTSISGVDFQPCFARRVSVIIGGTDVPFISLDDLLSNKREAGRTKDIADLEELG